MRPGFHLPEFFIMFDNEPVLIREPAVRPAPTVFENSTITRQQQLFSRGRGELPGQSLLFDPIAMAAETETDEAQCEH